MSITKYDKFEDWILRDLKYKLGNTWNLISGTYSESVNSPWYKFLTPMVYDIVEGYRYIHGSDDGSLDIVPDYDTNVLELNQGMEEWEYSEWSLLTVKQQEIKYEWFLTNIFPYCNKSLFRVEDSNNICVYDAKHLKRVYYDWMNKKLGNFAIYHGGASKCAPLKGFYIYLAKKGIRIYQGSPKVVREFINRCGGVNKPDRIAALHEKLVKYAELIDRSKYDSYWFDRLDKVSRKPLG